MCLNPTILPNKNWKKEDNLSPRYIRVDCGRCAECQERKSQEWAYRYQAESTKCEKMGGKTLLLGLHYDDRHLPKLTTMAGKEVTTWNKKHITKFIKALLQKVRRVTGLTEIIKYSCVTERGSSRYYKDNIGLLRKGTERPHYHMILWIYKENIPVSGNLHIGKKGDHEAHMKNYHGAPYLHQWIMWLCNELWRYESQTDVKIIDRRPEVAAMYIAKYVSKQHDDKIYRIPLNSIKEHNQSIDWKDMHMFNISSIYIGKDKEDKMTLQNYTGEEPLKIITSEGIKEIPMTKYYYNRNIHYIENNLDKINTVSKIREKWTTKNGYQPETICHFVRREEKHDVYLMGHEYINKPLPSELKDTPMGKEARLINQRKKAQKKAELIKNLELNKDYFTVQQQQKRDCICKEYGYHPKWDAMPWNENKIRQNLDAIKSQSIDDLTRRFMGIEHHGVRSSLDQICESMHEFAAEQMKISELNKRKLRWEKYKQQLPTITMQHPELFTI